MGDEFIFMFGYESPDDHRANAYEPHDFESWGCIRVRASGALDAKAWGVTVAGWYVGRLYDEDGSEGGWCESNFANWVETGSDETLLEQVGELPSINAGEFPDFLAMKRAFKD